MADKLGECCYGMSPLGRKLTVQSCKSHSVGPVVTYTNTHLGTHVQMDIT